MDSEGSPASPAPLRSFARRWRALVAACLAAAVTVGVVVATRGGGATGTDSSDLPTPQDARGWTLVWQSEFNDGGLDPTQWQVENRSTYGDGNLELACLMDRPENLLVAEGALSLIARREVPPLACGTGDSRFPGGRAYSSAMVTTQGHASWTYGLVEVRASLPTVPGQSQGLWPAIWMRPDDGGVGEIDIMEALGTGQDRAEEGKIHQSSHYDYQGTHQPVTSVPALPAGFDPTQPHVYAVRVQPGLLQWFVDGKVTFSVGSDSTPWLGEVLGKPYFLRLNLAVGGRWPGDPDASTVLPAAMRVDWVRVYQR